MTAKSKWTKFEVRFLSVSELFSTNLTHQSPRHCPGGEAHVGRGKPRQRWAGARTAATAGGGTGSDASVAVPGGGPGHQSQKDLPTQSRTGDNPITTGRAVYSRVLYQLSYGEDSNSRPLLAQPGVNQVGPEVRVLGHVLMQFYK